MFPLEFQEKFGPQKTRIMGLPSKWRQFDDSLSRFNTIPACDGQTDRRTVFIINVRSITDTHQKLEATNYILSLMEEWKSCDNIQACPVSTTQQ